MNIPHILIIEDDDFQYEIYEETLGRYRLTRTTTWRAALKRLAQDPPNVVILDHVLAEGELGLDFLPEFKQVLPHVPVIIVSGALEVKQQLAALQGPRRAHYCLPKPVDVHELQATIVTALTECGDAEVVRQFEALERSRRVDANELLSRSTDRLSRQNRILASIGSAKGRPNISAFAREFKVARRTIIRDLQELIRRGELGAEVYPEWENPPVEDKEQPI